MVEDTVDSGFNEQLRQNAMYKVTRREIIHGNIFKKKKKSRKKICRQRVKMTRDI